MSILLNGQSRNIPEGSTVAALLTELNLNPKYLAVELNRQVLSRLRHAETLLADGDRVEIVTLVGGG
ncbi:sulfur carrier protein ThiS [bacterium]|nr:sulfur carrier protein ThiS [bacterium]